MKNQTFRMTMLFDFYGELLTDRQKEFYDLYYNEDLSLSEIAENYGISRQGVRDVIVRAENYMTEIEDKTGLIKRFMQLRPHTEKIADECMEKIFLPTIRAMKAEGRPFKGCLYFGLMLTPDGPKVIEYNCRFGDTQGVIHPWHLKD